MVTPKLLVFAALAGASSYAQSTCDGAGALPWSEAKARLVEKAPVSPGVLARVEGIVPVEVCVGATGEVTEAQAMRFKPLLTESAVESAKKWRFQAGAPFRTVIEISFGEAIITSQRKTFDKAVDRYAEAERICRHALSERNAKSAVARCEAAAVRAGQLPAERASERRIAHGLAGEAQARGGDEQAALTHYQQELRWAMASLKPDQAELAYAHHHVAKMLSVLGRAVEAAEHFGLAEKVLALAHEQLGKAGPKPLYAATLRQVRTDYLSVLRQSGRSAEAAELERRMGR